ncbi:MAG: methylenetetrahydrofolate--tRNA-(uracil(54)-C(5))-methyltransferase (FADH(2)-oxidizing) TrmFO [Rickettsiales bacterium]
MTAPLHIIGAGLAGSEAAWQAAERGVQVVVHEMRGVRKTEAHHTDFCAELVCSNSFRSDDHERNAVGLLHEEMRRCDSIILKCADANKVPAGGALAMDRDAFAASVTAALEAHPNITFVREEISELPTNGHWIIATGPLTSPALGEAILRHTGQEYLAFFDAIAPIVTRESIDMNTAWFQSRYDKVGPGGDGKDYINCPMDKAQYLAFIDALNAGEKTEFKEWEKNTPYFEGCLPIEVMASRGPETLRFGPMKPVGLTNPHANNSSTHRGEDGPAVRSLGEGWRGADTSAALLGSPHPNPPPMGEGMSPKPYAVVQLRQDNKLGTLYNIVGFQTKLKYAEQQRIFRSIPGLQNAEFARLGGIHRNTFINSPVLLDATLRLKSAPHIRFAGQVTGVEGYVESAACGLLAGRFAAEELLSFEGGLPPFAPTALTQPLSGSATPTHESPNTRPVTPGLSRGPSSDAPSTTEDGPRHEAGVTGSGIFALPPRTTALGALLAHITGEANAETFQPMNVNFGLFPPLPGRTHKKSRPEMYTARAKADLAGWLESTKAAA